MKVVFHSSVIFLLLLRVWWAQGDVLFSQVDTANAINTGLISTNLLTGSRPGVIQLADDFTVPNGTQWNITSILMKGFFGAGANSTFVGNFTLQVYSTISAPDTDNSNLQMDIPGTLLFSLSTNFNLQFATLVNPANFDANFVFTSTPLLLNAGKYWASVFEDNSGTPGQSWGIRIRNITAVSIRGDNFRRKDANNFAGTGFTNVWVRGGSAGLALNGECFFSVLGLQIVLPPPPISPTSGTTAAATTAFSQSSTTGVVATTAAVIPISVSPPSSTAGIVGGIVGGVVAVALLVIIVIIVVLRVRSRKTTELELQDSPSRAQAKSNDYGPIEGHLSLKTRLDPLAFKDKQESAINLIGDKAFVIPLNELILEKEIGVGAFGQVFKATWRGSNVAIKQCNAKVGGASLEDFKTEAKLMAKLRPHSNVVQFLGIGVSEDDKVFLVTEFMDGGSLFDYLQSDAKLDANMVQTFARGIAAGMLHLHSENIIHRDLAARNVLLNKSANTIKIADFGMSRVLVDTESKSNQTVSTVGPVKWMPPESIKKREYSTYSDIWAYGVTLWEILSRITPFPELDAVQAAIEITTNNLRLHFPDYTPAILKKIAEQCFQEDPKNRGSFQDICDQMSKAPEIDWYPIVTVNNNNQQ